MTPAANSDQFLEQRRNHLLLSTDPARLDVSLIHRFLTDCYWAKGIPLEIVAHSIRNSLCFGIYENDQQVGFALVISDFPPTPTSGTFLSSNRFAVMAWGNG